MGIAGSIVDHTFFEKYLGMRVETVDMTEILGESNAKYMIPKSINVLSPGQKIIANKALM